ncbi:MAG: hypothetical protein N3A69_03700 [Leptospiraceae bacterium]|nr:hypothetical protein [Leptospiraceae bacterium]
MVLMIVPIAAATLLGVALFLFLKSYFKFDKNFYIAFGIMLLIIISLNFLASDIRFGTGPDTNSLFVKPGELVVYDPKSEYYVFFTKGKIDFTKLAPGAGNHLIDCYAYFGKATVFIRPDVPTRILLYPTFGLIKLPNGMRYIPFFRNFYPNQAFKEDKPAIDIKINIMFGFVEVTEEDPSRY